MKNHLFRHIIGKGMDLDNFLFVNKSIGIVSDPCLFFDSIVKHVQNSINCRKSVKLAEAIEECKYLGIPYELNGNSHIKYIFDGISYDYNIIDRKLSLTVNEDINFILNLVESDEPLSAVVREVPSPKEISAHVEIILSHTSKFYALFSDYDIKNCFAQDYKNYCDIVSSLLDFFALQENFCDLEYYLYGSLFEVLLMPESQDFKINCQNPDNEQLDFVKMYSCENIQQGVAHFVHEYNERRVKVEKDILALRQKRLCLLNKISELPNNSFYINNQDSIVSDILVKHYLAKLLDWPVQPKFRYLGKGSDRKRIDDIWDFEFRYDCIQRMSYPYSLTRKSNMDIKTLAVEYQNFKVEYIVDSECITLTFSDKVMQVLHPEKKMLEYKINLPSLNLLDEYDEHLTKSINDEIAIIDEVKKDTNKEIVLSFLKVVLKDVCPLVNEKLEESWGYRLSLSFDEDRDLSVDLCLEDWSNTYGDSDTLSCCFMLSKEPLESLLSQWRVNFDEWKVCERDYAKGSVEKAQTLITSINLL